MIMRAVILVFLLALLSLSPASPARGSTAPVSEQQSTGWQIVGQVGGPTRPVALQGSYAYVGVGQRLVAIDV